MGSAPAHHQVRHHKGRSHRGFPLFIKDVSKIGFLVGLYDPDDDPIGSRPAHGVYFEKPASGATSDKVDLITRNNGNETSQDDKFTFEDQDEWDVVVVLSDDTTNTVTFYWRECPSGFWSSQTVTSNVPDDTDSELHFSVAVWTDENAGTTEKMVAKLFEFEADSSERV